jgi:hypothetical protein
MALNKSSKLKSQKSRKAWEMVRAGFNYKTIGVEVGYTQTAIRKFAYRKYKEESLIIWKSEIVSVGACEICTNEHDLHPHHILEESIWPHLSRDLSNGICLCDDHHFMNPQISPHKIATSVEEFIAWLERYRNGQWLWREDHKTDRKYIRCDYERAYHELT